MDRQEKLWIGTENTGLYCFDPQSQNLEQFTEKEGLLSNTVYGILEDSQGSLWMSTKRGVSKFNPAAAT